MKSHEAGIIRQLVLDRDGNKCQKCGESMTSELVIHHKQPRRHGGKDELENLVTLCKRCHPAEERRSQSWTSKPIPKKIHVIEYEEEVKPFGNGAHILVDKAFVGKKVRVRVDLIES